MHIILQPIRLDTDEEESDGMLVLRDGQLLAVASRLSDHHEALAGSLFVEAVFGARDGEVGKTFADEDELVRWAQDVGRYRVQPEPLSAGLSRLS